MAAVMLAVGLLISSTNAVFLLFSVSIKLFLLIPFPPMLVLPNPHHLFIHSFKFLHLHPDLLLRSLVYQTLTAVSQILALP